MEKMNVMKNVAKLINLKNALADCGIIMDFTHKDGIISLNGTLWNSINGNNEDFCVFIDEDGDINHCITPDTDRQMLFDELMSWLK